MDRGNDGADSSKTSRRHTSASSSNDHDSKRSKHSSSKSKRHDKHDSERSRKRRHTGGDDKHDDDKDEWVEKKEPASLAAVSDVATSSRRPLDPPTSTFSVGSQPSLGGFSGGNVGSLTDGYGEGEVGDSTGGMGTDSDFFGALGIERKRKEKKAGVDPTVSSRYIYGHASSVSLLHA